LGVVLLGVVSCGWGQQDSAPAGTQVAPAAAAADKAQEPDVAPSGYYKKNAKGKLEYVGPKTIVELPPTPMLDEEGKQRLDPDGKPMFNPPVKQQRDKRGNPLFDDKGKPVMQTADNLGYDDKGKKIHGKKEKRPKMVSVKISRGTLTVDGMVGKAALNYDIADLKYIYLYAPGLGVTVVSNAIFPGAIEQKNAFDDKTLDVKVDDHTLELYSDGGILGKKPESAFVVVDREFKLPSRFPVMGYGTTAKPPYAWPGAKPNKELAGPVPIPPLPQDLRPVLLLAPCPAGQMRMAGPPVLPGQTAPVQPCVPIAKGGAPASPAQAAAAPATPPQ
jgi:hypothetical protein